MVRPAPWTARLLVCMSVACLESTPPPPPAPGGLGVAGDYVLVWTDDWVAAQRCNYVMFVDHTVCGWGRLTLTSDTVAISVLGSDVHAGLGSGPLIGHDSVVDTTALRLIDACMLAVDDTLVEPNGVGTLSGDTLRFVGRGLFGLTLHWHYTVVQLRGGATCA